MLISQTGTSTLYCSFIMEDFQMEYTEVGTPDYYSFQDIVRKEVGGNNHFQSRENNRLIVSCYLKETHGFPFVQRVYYGVFFVFFIKTQNIISRKNL